MQGQALPVIPGFISERLSARGKALLYFHSPHCGPCRAMTPEIERLSQQHDNVFIIDLSQDISIAKKFRVMATPTVLILTPQIVESVLLGQIPVSRLQDLLA